MILDPELVLSFAALTFVHSERDRCSLARGVAEAAS